MGFDKGEKKAIMLFEDHIEDFSEFLGRYRSRAGERGMNYYFEDYSKFSRTRITYSKNKKLLSNTYSMDFTLFMDNLQMEADWEAKLVFKGMVKMSGARLKHVSGDKHMVRALNENKSLMDGIMRCSQHVDIFSMTFRYAARSGQLRIMITPYNGGFLWIKFPPIFYPMRFTREEIYHICELFNLLGLTFININVSRQESEVR